MLRWIVGSSISIRLLMIAAAAAILVLGITRLHDMPADVLPEYGPPTVEIQTEALGLSAAEVEQMITVPIEQDLLSGVAFLDDMRSESLPGLSRIFMTFEKGTDLYRARQVVAERMTQAHALPNVSKPPQVLQPLSATNRVLIVGATSETRTPVEMGVLARWTIAPKLVGVEGVANVSIWGFRDRQLQVQVDPKKLRDENVSLLQVIESAGNSLWFSPLSFVEASTPGVGGFIDTPNQRLGVQHLSPINSAKDLSKVSVDDTGDRKLILSDVANVVEDHQQLIGDAFVNEGDGDLLFVIEKLPEANTLEVTRGLESALAEMKPGLGDVDIDSKVYRPASYIDRAVHNVKTGAIIGAALLAALLLAFLFQWRTALIAFVTVPLSLTTAALLLWAFGTTFNAIILAGLAAAFALLVEHSVSTVDNIERRLRENSSADVAKPTGRVVVEATVESQGIALYVALMLGLAFLPFFFSDQLAGAFFPDAIGAFLLATAASVVFGLTVAPALASLLLSKMPRDRNRPLAAWFERVFGRLVPSFVARPRRALLGFATLVVAGAVAGPFLSTDLLPTLKEDQVLIRWNGPPSTSLQEMQRVTGLAAEELRSVSGVRDVGAHVGRAINSDLSSGPNAAELWVSVDSNANYDSTLESIQDVVSGYPGLDRNVGVFTNTKADDLYADRSDHDVVVRLYGEDPDQLQTQARRIEKTVSGVSGVGEATIEKIPVEPTVEIEVDLAAAQAKGIKPGDVRRAAATLLGGLVVGNLFEQQKVFEVVVWGTPETRHSVAAIPELLVDTPDGRRVRLGDVADVRVAPNPSVINRQAVSRYVDIGVDTSGRGRDDVVEDINDRLEEMQLPLEYHAAVLDRPGQPDGRLIGIAVGAAIGVLLLLQACFGSWRLAALGTAVFPVAVAGGIIAITANGGTLDFGTVVALFGIFGLAATSGLLLIERVRRLEGKADGRARADLVVQAAKERTAPVVLSALATIVVLLPFAIRGSIAGYELVEPVALALIGGVIASTFVTLFVLPAAYVWARPPVPAPESESDVPEESFQWLRPGHGGPAPAGPGVHQASAEPGA